MSALKKMVLPYFKEINQSNDELTAEDLEYMADKLSEDVRKWLKARADFEEDE